MVPALHATAAVIARTSSTVDALKHRHGDIAHAEGRHDHRGEPSRATAASAAPTRAVAGTASNTTITSTATTPAAIDRRVPVIRLSVGRAFTANAAMS